MSTDRDPAINCCAIVNNSDGVRHPALNNEHLGRKQSSRSACFRRDDSNAVVPPPPTTLAVTPKKSSARAHLGSSSR